MFSVLACSVSCAFRVPNFLGQLNIVSMYIHMPTICMYIHVYVHVVAAFVEKGDRGVGGGGGGDWGYESVRDIRV